MTVLREIRFPQPRRERNGVSQAHRRGLCLAASNPLLFSLPDGIDRNLRFENGAAGTGSAMDVVIAIDSGTTATKAVAVGPDATVLATGESGYALLLPRPGYVELDGVRLQQAAVEALTDVVASLPGDAEVIGICLSAAMHGVVPMAADGKPLGPVITWADSRASDEASSIKRDAPHLHGLTGTPIHPMSPLAKFAWLRASEPQMLASASHWGGVKELAIAALCEALGGKAVFATDLSCASAMGMFNIHKRDWEPEALEFAGVRLDQLPDVLSTTECAGRLSREVAAITGLSPGIPVIAGASDGPLGNLGLGAIGYGIAAISLGTSGAMRAVRDRPGVDPDGRLFCYALTEDRWVLGGPINNAGSVVRWASAAFGAVSPGTADPDAWTKADVTLLSEASAVPAGSDGLLCLPYLLGERAPWWVPGLAGAYVGLRRDHTRAHLVRAAVEGVCQQFAFIHDALLNAGVAVDHVRATGGAIQSELWRQTLAACLGMPVGLAETPEGTAVGAGLLGHYALGSLPDLDTASELIEVHAVAEPDAAAARLYERLRPLLRQSTAGLAETFEALNRISESVRSGV